MKQNFQERAIKVAQITEIKWKARIKHNAPDPKDYLKEETDNEKSALYPKEVVELINLKTALCKGCQAPCNSKHLTEDHNVQVPTNEEILQKMKDSNENLKTTKEFDKNALKKKLRDSLEPYIESIKTLLL